MPQIYIIFIHTLITKKPVRINYKEKHSYKFMADITFGMMQFSITRLVVWVTS